MFGRWTFAIYSGPSCNLLSRALSLPVVAASYAASIAYLSSCNRTYPVARERELPVDTSRFLIESRSLPRSVAPTLVTLPSMLGAP